MLNLLRLILPHHWVWRCLSARARDRQIALDRQPRAWAEPEQDPLELVALLPFLAGRVLEVGAGDGTVTRQLVRSAQVTALEPDPVRFARGAAAVPEARWLPHSWETLRDEGLWDRVLTAHTLHHIADRPACAQWVARQLRPGGLWLVLEPRHTWRRAVRLTGKYLRYWWWRPWAAYGATHDFLTDGEMRALCRQSGLAWSFEVRCRHATLWVVAKP